MDSTREAESELKELQKQIPVGVPPKEAAARLASLEGYLQTEYGDDNQAEVLYDKALADASGVIDDPCWQAELLVTHRAQTLRNLKDFARSEESLQRAEKPAQACGDTSWSISIPFVRGNSYNDEFLFEKAIASFQEGLQRAKAVNNLQMTAKINGSMALTYSNMGDSDRAFEVFGAIDEYYESRRNQLSKEDWQTWETDIGHRARTYFLLKRYEEAEPAYLRAIKIATETQDTDWLVLWRAELTAAYIENADYQAANRLNQQVIKQADFKNDSFSANRAFLNDAKLKRLNHEFEEAEKVLDKLQNEPANGKDPKIIWEIEVERARVLADTNHVAEARQQFEAALNTANAVRNSIQSGDYRLTYLLQLRGIYESYVDFLAKHNQAAEALRVADSGHARMLAEKLNLPRLPKSTTDFSHIAKAKNAVILSYSITPKDSYMWVTTASTIKPITLPANTFKKVQLLITNHDGDIRDQRSIYQDESGQKLYEALIGPASQYIEPGKNVIVIPDGPLSSLNFETLVPPGDKRQYWIESANITVAPSLTLLTTEPQLWIDPATILLIGDAIPSAQENLPPLGREDIDHIAGLYPMKCTLLTKERATPSGFLREAAAKQYSWIYLSAHAKSFPQSPLDSYVVLSPETNGGDYKLSARDLAKLVLKTNLVTLSACQSAGAKNIPGEGLVGLSWAVLGAGARNVVASLWPVDAHYTDTLMKNFYGHLHQHQLPADALRSAKLDMVRANAPPYSWAAFQIYSR